MFYLCVCECVCVCTVRGLTWCLATMWAVWISGGLMEGLYCRGWPSRE